MSIIVDGNSCVYMRGNKFPQKVSVLKVNDKIYNGYGKLCVVLNVEMLRLDEDHYYKHYSGLVTVSDQLIISSLTRKHVKANDCCDVLSMRKDDELDAVSFEFYKGFDWSRDKDAPRKLVITNGLSSKMVFNKGDFYRLTFEEGVYSIMVNNVELKTSY